MERSFDITLGVSDVYGTHSIAGVDKDRNIILRELLNAQVFCKISNRQMHCTRLYEGMKNPKKLDKWMLEHATKLRNLYRWSKIA